MKVYLVIADPNCFPEDGSPVTIKAFISKRKATNWARKARARAEELVLEAQGLGYYEKRDIYDKNEFDPHMQVPDGEAPTYYVEELFVED